MDTNWIIDLILYFGNALNEYILVSKIEFTIIKRFSLCSVCGRSFKHTPYKRKSYPPYRSAEFNTSPNTKVTCHSNSSTPSLHVVSPSASVNNVLSLEDPVELAFRQDSAARMRKIYPPSAICHLAFAGPFPRHSPPGPGAAAAAAAGITSACFSFHHKLMPRDNSVLVRQTAGRREFFFDMLLMVERIPKSCCNRSFYRTGL